MTQPGAASRPQRSPRAKVSSGLREMNVTMNVERADALLISESETRFCGDAPDTGERQFGKLLFPRIKQRHGLAAGDGEEQFEILAIREGGHDRRLGGSGSARLIFCSRTDGDGGFEQIRSQLGRVQEMPEVAGQTVAQINHRVD